MADVGAYIATLAAGLWAGAAFYILVAEHPAALQVGVGFATAYFRPMSRRTAPLMMVLAAIGAVAGFVAWESTDHVAWLVGAIMLAALFPFTAILIVPVNLRILKIAADDSSETAKSLHARWGVMHAWRTVLGSTAFPLFLWALSRLQES